MRNCEAVQKLTKPIIFILIGFLLLLTGCKNDDNKLKIPSNLAVTEDEYLVWDEVPNATNYSIYIKKNDKTEVYDSTINKLDVFEIMDEVGKYEFNVLAYDDNSKYLDSDYSQTIDYEIKSQLDNLEFKLTNNTYDLSIKEPTKIVGKLIIPEIINGKKVDCSKRISFNRCDNMTSIILPDTISKSSFFVDCDNLRRIKLSNGCKKLETMTIKDCNLLTELRIPDEVTTFSQEAICSNKSLKKVYIGKNVSKIDLRNFSNCDSLDTILIDENNIAYYSLDNCILKKDDNSILYGNKNSKIPALSNNIENCAFTGCGLEELIIPSHIKTVGYSAFAGCEKLKKVVIEEGISEIENAFMNCGSLEEITIPNSLKTLGKDFFAGLKSLKKINLSDNNDKFLVDGNCFIQKDNNKLLFAMPNATIPNYIKTIGYISFSVTNLKEIIIPDSVEEIEDSAFRKTNIEKVVFGLNVKKIGASAFEYCPNLKKVILNDCLEEIQSSAFYNCYQLEGLSLPESVKRIGDSAFYNCICSVVLHKTIEKIGYYGFYGCAVYTDFDYKEYIEFLKKNNPYPDNPGFFQCLEFCPIFFCCDIKDNYVYLHTYTYSPASEYNVGSAITGKPTLVVPYREGYEFVGFSTVEGSSVVEYEPILVKNEFEILGYDTVIIYKKEYYMPFDNRIYSNNVDRTIVLYSIWKKVD